MVGESRIAAMETASFSAGGARRPKGGCETPAEKIQWTAGNSF